MILIVEELKSTLSQEVTWSNVKRTHLKAIRPYIYMHNAPSGTFTISVKKGSDLLAESSFTSADIKSELSTTENYIHLWKTVSFVSAIPINSGNYTIELSSMGYTFSETSYIGWIKEHEDLINNNNQVGDFPLSIQFWTYGND